MKQKVFIQPLSVLIAVMVFTSAVGIAVDMHFCKGSLKTISFFGKAKPCMEMVAGKKVEVCTNTSSSLPENIPLVSKKKCCNNYSIYTKVNTTANTKYIPENYPSTYFAVIQSYISKTYSFVNIQSCHIQYSKPPPNRDFVRLYQMFRI